MQSQQIESAVKALVENFSEKDFIYDFLLAFGFTKMTVKRLREGNSNLAKKDNQLIVKQKLFYEYSSNDDLYSIIEDLKNDSTTYTHKPRFIVVNNVKELLAIDTKTKETLAVELNELHKNIDFFLPWTGKEKYVAHQENPADIKAAEKMAHIYDEIVKLNPELTQKDKSHSLNVFLTRLLFCFFAEDTGIFDDNVFTKTIVNHTNEDGSDLADFLKILFESLDKTEQDKVNYPSFIQDFPYVNGELFKSGQAIPKLNSKVRKLMIDCGNQDWKEINPDIFGSMFQAVSIAEVRSGLGQHYTSVPNIMKVIEPLFLNDLKEEYEKADTEKKLLKLLSRIYNLRIFDPACGSGNFLIIAYKQLRLLEMDIIKKIEEITGKQQLMLSQLQLNQFYGIEIDDFACEIARLSLWLAEHQMNRKFKDLFGNCRPSLPLRQSGNIICGNATRFDWEKICPKGIKGFTYKEMEQMTLLELEKYKQLELQGTDYEIYILGNPPYLGFKFQDAVQKSDMEHVFRNFGDYKQLDYIACWFFKAAQYIGKDSAKAAFVSTNSICQGSIVELLWEKLEKLGIEIDFAVKSFKWSNNAKGQAGVTCIIVGLRHSCEKEKYLYTSGQVSKVKNINYYLIDAPNIIVKRRKEPISSFPKITDGSGALDGGFLILTDEEKNSLCSADNRISEFIFEYLGSNEYINGIKRWCIWIEDNNLDKAKEIEEINSRIQSVYNFRSTAGTRAQTALSRPHKFAWINKPDDNQIIIPTVSSENREYVPMGFLSKDIIVSNSASIVHNPEPWMFGVLNSKMHMVWVRLVAGKLEERIRYTSALCYNTFPFPDISDKQKKIIEMHVNNILAEREKHSDKTMAELYDPDKMPQGLREAHRSLDLAIEKCYRQAPFESDEKRLEHLFKRYEIMTDPTKQANVEEQLSLL